MFKKHLYFFHVYVLYPFSTVTSLSIFINILSCSSFSYWFVGVLYIIRDCTEILSLGKIFLVFLFVTMQKTSFSCSCIFQSVFLYWFCIIPSQAFPFLRFVFIIKAVWLFRKVISWRKQIKTDTKTTLNSTSRHNYIILDLFIMFSYV